MFPRWIAVIILMSVPGFSQDWKPQLAAQYLDSRQKEWFAWREAATPEGPCLSCHTGMTYLLARPVLRRALGESQPTSYEQVLVNTLRARVEKKKPEELAKQPSATVGVEGIFSALFLVSQDAGRATLTEKTTQALDQLWSLQIREGNAKGAWPWFSFNLDPFETPDSVFYGAALAALAVGTAPAEYRQRADVRERVDALTGYLQREQQAQPLHNRLALLWASSRLPGALSESVKRALIDEILRKQQPDGGWTIESLGPWRPHPEAPGSQGSSGYATGFAAFALQKAGVSSSNPGIARALAWLRSHQDPQSGHWTAGSMNKKYEPDSMQVRFMQDAATAFAALALLESR